MSAPAFAGAMVVLSARASEPASPSPTKKGARFPRPQTQCDPRRGSEFELYTCLDRVAVAFNLVGPRRNALEDAIGFVVEVRSFEEDRHILDEIGRAHV